MYGLREARSSLLSEWLPPSQGMTPSEADNLERHVTELKAAVDAGLWKSVSMLSGQLIEGALRHRLIASNMAAHADVTGKTFGELIRLAQHTGLVPDYDAPLTQASPLSAALTLRNWASHLSFWSDYPTELRASQCLALMVCTVEALLASPVPNFEHRSPDTNLLWVPSWHEIAPNILMRALASLPTVGLQRVLLDAPEGFYRHVVENGALSTVYSLSKLMKRGEVSNEQLREAIHEQFAALVRHASRTTVQSLAVIPRLLRSLDLADHARLFAVLLPFDPVGFAAILRGLPPASVAVYVAECFRAEPDVFAAKASDVQRMAPAIQAFWEVFASATGNILNPANILGRLPARTRGVILLQAPEEELVAWVDQSDPMDSVNLLGSLNNRVLSRTPQLTRLRDRVLGAIHARIGSSSSAPLHQLPLRLHRLKLDSDPSVVPLVEKAIDAFRPEFDWSGSRRLLWDSMQYFPSLAAKALDVALRLTTCAGLPPWDRCCLVGMLQLARPNDTAELSATLPSDPGVFEATAAAGVDRWQLLLGGLALSKAANQRGLHLSETVAARLRGIVATTPDADTPLSLELLTAVKKAMSQ